MALAKAGIPVPAHSLEKRPGWLARRYSHMEANDLLAGLTYGDYYVQYVPTVREHRIHVYDGRSIRVAMKEPRTPNPNPRFRSWQAGWKLVASPANTGLLPPGARDLAAKAVKALGYEFGAVDVGTQENGKPIVWEVNSQPGIEGGTVKAYAHAILRQGGLL
jgi:glutathione synthase/RimK-type ligase-like ATP-grasp enzyme